MKRVLCRNDSFNNRKNTPKFNVYKPFQDWNESTFKIKIRFAAHKEQNVLPSEGQIGEYSGKEKMAVCETYGYTARAKCRFFVLNLVVQYIQKPLGFILLIKLLVLPIRHKNNAEKW
jgi:hypothetical protein